MGFNHTVKNAAQMMFFIVLSWIVGIIGLIVLVVTVYQALLHQSKTIGLIGVIIGIGILGFAILIYTHYSNKHDIDFQPGHRTRTKYVNY